MGLEGSDERFGSPDACVSGTCGHETVESVQVQCTVYHENGQAKENRLRSVCSYRLIIECLSSTRSVSRWQTRVLQGVPLSQIITLDSTTSPHPTPQGPTMPMRTGPRWAL